MSISEMIKELEKLKQEKGDLNIVMWKYTGGNDELFYVTPVFKDIAFNGVIVMESDGLY